MMKTSNHNTPNIPTVLLPLTSTIPQTSSQLGFRDVLGAVRVRWGIKRNAYMVEPGLYKIGKPGNHSDVFVTANYKLSFDALRKNLDGLDAWILVLDTKGINVWCAAGKGTFGTAELIYRIKETGLNELIVRKRIIVPQLGAVGVSAHEVKKHSGFTVLYGPVRAKDIKDFIAAGYKTDKKMRKVNFTFVDRLKLIPVELANAKYLMLGTISLFLILTGLYQKGISVEQIKFSGLQNALTVLIGFISGAVFGPLLLPVIPFRSFSLKGALVGLLTASVLYLGNYLGETSLDIISWFLLLPAISSYLVMNFTGASTYTSLAGVKKEMRIAVPLQIIFLVAGLVLFIISKFL